MHMYLSICIELVIWRCEKKLSSEALAVRSSSRKQIPLLALSSPQNCYATGKVEHKVSRQAQKT